MGYDSIDMGDDSIDMGYPVTLFSTRPLPEHADDEVQALVQRELLDELAVSRAVSHQFRVTR